MPDDNALLTRARAIFYTQDDDKNPDTWLECWINQKGGHEAAYASVEDQGFSDNSVHEVDLEPKTNPMRHRDIPGSWFLVRIHPNGNDTWRFHCDVALEFADGSTYKKEFPDTTDISQDVTQATFNL